MAAGQRRRRISGKKKRWRRRKRIIKAWCARILVLAVLLLIIFLAVRSALWVWGRMNGSEEAFVGARIIEDLGFEKDDRVVIVLDAGHGGRDQGTSSGDILEKEINLRVAERLEKVLKEQDVKVLLTRTDDTKVGLEDRAKYANEQEADIFVSIHCNYCEEDAGVNGLECYYREDSEEGKTLAEQIIEGISADDAIACRGTRTANFRVLTKTDMPAVLVEIGYLSNQGERGKLTDESYQELLAGRLADGILSFKEGLETPEESDEQN
ncbi:MAG: N-acetylmuramoyl-L-alanine amidase [Lachnospiraceae bacterium]|nr:N-acetylmuramoyl-L-alanine amidase [Lachnospiraceae bacterium]